MAPSTCYYLQSLSLLTASQFVICSTSGQLDQLCSTENAVLPGGNPACLLLQSPKSTAALFHLGRTRHPHQPQPRAEWASRFRRPRSLPSRGLWPAAVCDLWAASRPRGGRGLRFPWGQAGCPPASVWGAGTGGAHWKLLCAAAPWWREGGLSDREADAPTHVSEGSSQPGATGADFAGHLPYAQRPQERKVSMTACNPIHGSLPSPQADCQPQGGSPCLQKL